MKAALVFLLVVISISTANAGYCQSLGYLNNFFNRGETTVRKSFELGTWLEKNQWNKVPIPVVGSVAVLQTCFPGVSRAFGHAGRVTEAQTRDGERYSFTLTGANQGCTVSEWHSACRAEVDCDDVSDWIGLKYTEGDSCALFYLPPVSPDDFVDDLPSEPSPQMPAGAGLCTIAHLRLRREPGALGAELVVVPRSREVLDLPEQPELVDSILYRAVEYTNPMGESFSGWAADAYLGPCAMIHYASDVLGPDEHLVEVAKAEVSDVEPVERVPGWSIGVMGALGGLVLVLLLSIVVLYLALRHYRKQVAAGGGLLQPDKQSHEGGFVQFSDVPTIAVMTSPGPTA